MPPNETFADLLRQAGIDRPAWEGVQGQRPPRPMPRQMRPPAQRANDPRLAQSERDRALRQFDRSNAANVDTYQRQGFDQRNRVAEAANMAAESTGLPAIRRAGSDLTRWGAYTAGTEQGGDDLASGALNLGAGSLGVLGMAGMVPRAPVRGALRPPVTRPMVQATDAGGGLAGQPNEFEIGPLYRGHDGDPSTGHWRASEGMNGEGVYLTHDETQANEWALRQAENDPVVHTVRVRGPIAEGMTFETDVAGPQRIKVLARPDAVFAKTPDAGQSAPGQSVGFPREPARSGNVLPPSPLDDMLRRLNIDPTRITYKDRRTIEYNLRLHGNGDRAEAWLERYLMNTWDRSGGGEIPTFTLPEGERPPASIVPLTREGEFAQSAPDVGSAVAPNAPARGSVGPPKK